MPSILDSLAGTIGGALGGIFHVAVLTRQIAGTPDPLKPWNVATPTLQEFSCKAIVSEFNKGLLRDSLVVAGDVNVMILSSTLSTDPLPMDSITFSEGPFSGQTYRIVPSGTPGYDAVRTDPAKAVWECRARQ